EPRSDDAKFFKRKALTYYGGGAYKIEETARRGAIATLIIYRTDLASLQLGRAAEFPGAERSYLQRDPNRNCGQPHGYSPRQRENLLPWEGWIWTSCLRKRNRKTSSRLNCPCDCRRA